MKLNFPKWVLVQREEDSWEDWQKEYMDEEEYRKAQEKVRQKYSLLGNMIG